MQYILTKKSIQLNSARHGEDQNIFLLGWGVPQGITPISYNLCETAKDVDKVLLNPLCYEF